MIAEVNELARIGIDGTRAVALFKADLDNSLDDNAESLSTLIKGFLKLGVTIDEAIDTATKARAALARKSKKSTGEALLSVVTDSRLKFFDSDVFTNVKSNSTLKSKVRKGYSSQCALCGSNGSAPAWPLSVAHLAPNNTALNYGEFGPPRYLTDCQPESIRNRMLLCGTKGDHGSCHSLFDFHNVIVYYDGFEATYKSLTLVPVIGSAFEVAYATSVLTFPPSLPVADYPYRRILAWRMRHAAVKHASTLDADRLETIVRMSELSEMPEMADRNDLDGEDASNEYGGSSNGDDVTNRSSGQDDGAAVLGSVIAQMGAMPNFSSEVGSL